MNKSNSNIGSNVKQSITYNCLINVLLTPTSVGDAVNIYYYYVSMDSALLHNNNTAVLSGYWISQESICQSQSNDIPNHYQWSGPNVKMVTKHSRSMEHAQWHVFDLVCYQSLVWCEWTTWTSDRCGSLLPSNCISTMWMLDGLWQSLINNQIYPPIWTCPPYTEPSPSYCQWHNKILPHT